MRWPLLATLGLGALIAQSTGQQVKAQPAPYEVVVAHTVMMPMRDGVRLAADIYFPAKDGVPVAGKFPAVLQKTPYGRQGAEPAGRYFASRGYVFLMVDCRGANDSEGVLYFYINDSKDGHDVVEWIARQPWSNGAVGTYGSSHGGMTQYATALARPPHLKAQFISKTPDDYHDGGGAWNGGAYMIDHNLEHTLGRIGNINRLKNDSAIGKRMAEVRQNYAAWMRVPASRHLELFRDIPEAHHWSRDWLIHADYDDYWKQVGFNLREHVQDYPDLPMFFIGGWYDHLNRPFLRGYVGLTQRGMRSATRLVSGPWVHGGNRSSHGQVEFGADAARDVIVLAERWMAQWLKGTETGVLREAAVRIFVMGTGDGHKTPDGRLFHGGYWRDEAQWPLTRAKPTRYYLHAGGSLSAQVPAASEPSGYGFDPNNPVPTIFGRGGGGWDQRCQKEFAHCNGDTLPLAVRPDVLVFRTAPLELDLEVTGPISVTLLGASDARDTDFTAKLIDEYPASKDFPDGFSLILVDQLLRARYRNSLERAELLEAGPVYKFVIALPPTSNVFKKGHRIRLDVSSSNFPKFDVNPNTGESIQFHTHTRVAHNKVYHDPQHASFIELPIVPSGAGPTSPGRE